MAQCRERSSEKAELNRKRAELDALRARHGDLRLNLQRLRRQVIEFEREYDETLGRRMAELERIEGEISLLGGSWTREEKVKTTASTASKTWRSEPQDIKALYREVAKAIHPDLVPAGAAQDDRNKLMSEANRAYASNDRKALQDILRTWLDLPANRAEAELASLERQIAQEREAILVTSVKVEEFRDSFVCRFNFKGEADCAGATLLAEMVHAVELQIDRAVARLSALKRLRGKATRQPPERDQRPRRRLDFPEEFTCGVVYARDRLSLNYSQWRRVGAARGSLQVPVDQAVRLDVKVQTGTLSHLQKLGCEDLQSLFLYGASDGDLSSIAHLTGLEELYLSGGGLTDAALRSISSLTGLKRLYIYQTGISDIGLSYLQHFPRLNSLTSSGNSITDAGLAGFERAIPRVKTTSFQWKR
jgi:curved DNA-binding protein CbpA